MIQHILKIVWNERKLNAWLVLEYIIVFCILWFCCDYLYSTARNYYGPSGFDINHTYRIEMQERPIKDETGEIDRYALAMTFMERVKRHPDIENVSLSNASIPHSGYSWMSGYQIDSDSVNQTLRERWVSSSFFDVFKMNIRGGRIFDWTDDSAENEVVISPILGSLFGARGEEYTPVPIAGVRLLRYDQDFDERKGKYPVIGTTDMIKDSSTDPYFSNAIHPLKRGDVNLSHNEIAVRVKPEADKNFASRFTKDMREQLFIGPYYLSNVVSVSDMRTEQLGRWGTSDSIKSTMAITAFLMVNIFLGILGSFWFRTQSRRSEIGLRVALGSSRRKVRTLIVLETLFLLTVSSIVATIICLSIGTTEIINTLGIPTFDKYTYNIGNEQYAINFAITFAFMAIVSILAVWYPAKQASDVQPAEALHDE